MAALIPSSSMRHVHAAILGYGRIARAIAYGLKKNNVCDRVTINATEKDVSNSDIIIAALAGELGEQGLEFALKYKKPLVDISDVDPPFYYAHKKQIEKSGIQVVPGCGFSPGLTNLIAAWEALECREIDHIEVLAGSLSDKPEVFPFLWCFEDLILEHKIPSVQKINGQNKKFPAFADERYEEDFLIPAESYYCASGFENLLSRFQVKNFTCRVLRPRGFRSFFKFLDNEGFLKKELLASTKQIVESNRLNNYTIGRIIIVTRTRRIIWNMQSFSSKNDCLNSMQKITSALPVIIAKQILDGRIDSNGLLFMEDLAQWRGLRKAIESGVRKSGIVLTRSEESKSKR